MPGVPVGLGVAVPLGDGEAPGGFWSMMGRVTKVKLSKIAATTVDTRVISAVVITAAGTPKFR